MKWYCNSPCPKSSDCARHGESGYPRPLYNNGLPEISNIEATKDGCTGYTSKTFQLTRDL